MLQSIHRTSLPNLHLIRHQLHRLVFQFPIDMYIINKHYIVLIFIIYVLYNYLLQGSTTEFLVDVPPKDLLVFDKTPVTEVWLFSIPYQLILNKLCTHFYYKNSCIYLSQQCTSNRPHQTNPQKNDTFWMCLCSATIYMFSRFWQEQVHGLNSL